MNAKTKTALKPFFLDKGRTLWLCVPLPQVRFISSKEKHIAFGGHTVQQACRRLDGGGESQRIEESGRA
jgi:hypothetical protein